MVTVYTKYNCPQCELTKTVLTNEGIEFQTINVEDDENALNYIKNELGFRATPVVIKEGHDPIVGFKPDKLKELAD